jgi:hypothetical protein
MFLTLLVIGGWGGSNVSLLNPIGMTPDSLSFRWKISALYLWEGYDTERLPLPGVMNYEC